jgi:isoquinoline 1-oxidoreductase subunit alpha
MTLLNINGKPHEVDADPTTPLLWAIREQVGLTGTKYGCGIAACGCCTVHIDGRATRSCVTPLSSVTGRRITTIEGLSPDGSHPLQKAWLELDVAQCGYCQSGQIMQAASLLNTVTKPTDTQIDEAMSGNLCRCGTYGRIKQAVRRASGQPLE